MVVGKVSEDRFNGGLRIAAEKVFDIAAARIHYGHKLEMDVACTISPAKMAEVRRFAKTKLKDLEPSRDPRMLCGVITGVRTQMTQRGKILIVALDDKTGVVEVTVYSELLEQNKNIFKEDEFLLVVGKVSEDRFNGGLRITAEKAYDIAAARIQYGFKLEMDVSCDLNPAKLAEVLQPHRMQDGMPVSLRIKPQGVEATLQLGDDWRVAPSDTLKQQLELVIGAKDVAVEY